MDMVKKEVLDKGVYLKGERELVKILLPKLLKLG